MGEIGIERNTALHELKWWEIRCIIRGYNRRHRHTWSAARWSTFYIMSAQVGSKGMQESHLLKPTDLIKFPWEYKQPSKVTQSDIDKIQSLMNAINSNLKK
ncbi:MAG: hypothetical protein J6X10_02085 [Bacteroidales bacterium]|nr:hypothetical protein [Bacteroidales bacterium]